MVRQDSQKVLRPLVLPDPQPDTPAEITFADLYRAEVSWNEKLMQVVRASEVLTSSLQLDEVLRRILTTLTTLIEGADAAAVFTYDEETDRLRPAAAVGFNWRYLSQMRLAPGESMTGQAFARSCGILFASNAETVQASMNMTPQNRSLYCRSILVPIENLTSAVAVALKVHGRETGALVVDSFHTGRYFDDRDLQLVTHVAVYAALAIENARAFEDQLQSAERIRRLNERIDAQNRALRRELDAQRAFTQALAAVKPLHELVTACQDALSARIYVLDEEGRVMEASAADPLPVGAAGLRPGSSVDPWEIAPGMWASPIEAGSVCLGWVVADTGPTLFDEVDLSILKQASTVAAAELLKERALQENALRHQGDFVESLLHRPDTPGLERRALTFGIRPDRSHRPLRIVLDIVGGDLANEEDRVQGLESFLRIAEEAIGNVFPGIAPFRNYDTVTLFVPEEDGITQERLRSLEQMISHDRLQACISFTIGRLATGLGDLSQALRETQNLQQFVGPGTKSGRIVWADRLGPLQLLIGRVSSEELACSCKRTLEPLLDQTDRTLLNTLVAYVEENGHTNATARRLYVHPNTVGYRMRQIEGVLQMDLSRWDHWSSIALAVKLAELWEWA